MFKTGFEAELDESLLCEQCKKEIKKLLLRYVPFLLRPELSPSARLASTRGGCDDNLDDKPLGRRLR